MPSIPRDYQPLPYVRPAYEPDTRTLAQLMALAGQAKAAQIGRQGETRARGIMSLGELISSGLAGLRQEREQKAASEAKYAQQQQESAFKVRDQQLKEAEFLARQKQLEDATAEKDQLQAEKRGDLRAKAIGYGPIGEQDVDTLMQSPERSGDVRYAFGPGTAQGPELQPTLDQQRGIQTERDIKALGGTLGPNGQVVMPPKPERPPQPTVASLAAQAANGDPAKALQLLREQRPAPVGGSSVDRDDAKAIADAIMSGAQPPEVTGLYRLAGPVRAELSKQGYDLSKANLDWKATQRHLNTLNGAQQTRLRQAIGTAIDSLDVIEDLSNQWKGGRFPVLNKANLALAKNGAFGQNAASIATQLEGQITDVTSELANAYMGGNSPTDHALQLASKNLNANWDQKVLGDMIKLARTNLTIRRNSIEHAGPITASSQQQQATPPKIDEEWTFDAKGNLVKKKGS